MIDRIAGFEVDAGRLRNGDCFLCAFDRDAPSVRIGHDLPYRQAVVVVDPEKAAFIMSFSQIRRWMSSKIATLNPAEIHTWTEFSSEARDSAA